MPLTNPAIMEIALEEARRAARREETPVGAVIVRDNEIISKAGNETRARFDPTAHAEVVAIRAAGEILQSQRLPGCELYVTLEPCAMCAAAISFARLNVVHFAASDPKGGAVVSGPRFFELPTCHHRPQIETGMGASESAELLRSFFRARR